jgi:ureidoacrylate peracid hydrolase
MPLVIGSGSSVDVTLGAEAIRYAVDHGADVINASWGTNGVTRSQVPWLEAAVERARQAGVLIVFVQAIYDPPYLSGPMRDRNRRRGVEAPRCISGTWGAEFCGVQPRPDEPVVVKHRYSAFAGTTLDAVLEERGIRSLLLVGVATEVCVESTARDGYFLDYYITMVADCCATGQREDQESALRRCERDFGIVATAAENNAAWQRPRAHAAATTARADAG